MTTARPEAVITIRAREAAQRAFDSVQRNIRTTTQQVGTMARAFSLLTGTLAATSLVISAVAAGLGVLVGFADAAAFIAFEVAARRSRLQLRLLGLSAEDAGNGVGALAAALDRATATSFFRSEKAVEQIFILGTSLAVELAQRAKEISDKFGLPVIAVFDALFQIATEGKTDLFIKLVGGTERLGQVDLSKLEPEEFLRLVEGVTDATRVTNLERLVTSFQELAALTEPLRLMALEVGAAILDTILSSIVTRGQEKATEIQDQIKIALSGAFLSSVVLGQAGFIGGRIGAAIAGGLVSVLVFEMVVGLIREKDRLLEDPVLTSALGLVALGLGRGLGSRIAGGLVVALGLLLFPGIKERLDELRQDVEGADQILLVGTLGFAVGAVLSKSLLGGLVLGQTLAVAFHNLQAGEEIQDIALKLSIQTAGAAIGLLLGKNVGAAFLGFIVAGFITDFVDEAFGSRVVLETFYDWGFILARSFLSGLFTLGEGITRFMEHEINNVGAAINNFIAGVEQALSIASRAVGGPGVALPRVPTVTLPRLGMPEVPIPGPFVPPFEGPQIPRGLPGGPGGPGGATTPRAVPTELNINLEVEGQALGRWVLDLVTGRLRRAGILPGGLGS